MVQLLVRIIYFAECDRPDYLHYSFGIFALYPSLETQFVVGILYIGLDLLWKDVSLLVNRRIKTSFCDRSSD